MKLSMKISFVSLGIFAACFTYNLLTQNTHASVCSDYKKFKSVQTLCKGSGHYNPDRVAALWIANAHNPKKIVVANSSGNTAEAHLWGMYKKGHPAYRATHIKISNDNGSITNEPKSFQRGTWGHPKSPKRTLRINIAKFTHKITAKPTDEGLSYTRSIKVYRCNGKYVPPYKPSSQFCGHDYVDVTIILPHASTVYRSRSTAFNITANTSAVSGWDATAATPNYKISNPSGSVQVSFKHTLKRFDTFNVKSKAKWWLSGETNSTTPSIAATSGTTNWLTKNASLNFPSSGSYTKTITPAPGTYRKKYCQTLRHNKITTINISDQTINSYSSGKAASSACVTLSRPFSAGSYNVNVTLNQNPVFLGENTTGTVFFDVTQSANTPAATSIPADSSISVAKFIVDKSFDPSSINLSGNNTTPFTNTPATTELCNFAKQRFGAANIKGCTKLTEKPLTANQTDQQVAFDTITPDLDVAVGDKLCVVAASNYSGVTGHSNSSQPNKEWRFSNLSCRSIAKKPNLQILNGHVYSPLSVNTSFSPKFTYSTLTTTNPTKTAFGSWGEYLAISNADEIHHFASGAALNGGTINADVCSYSPLTISNRQCASNLIGKSGIVASSSFASRIWSLFGNTGTVTDTLHASLIPANGQPQVFRSEGDITIDGNIIHAGHAHYDLSSLPQVIILADNINITHNVSRLDAWLIASNTINTCSDVSTNDLSNSTCNQTLVINGPLYANNVNFNRTAGANGGAASAHSAEIINLTPSAYLWGFQQASKDSSASTVYSRELAPRK